MLGSRSGDIDPGIINYLLHQTGMDIQELDDILNTNSGLTGICGLSDMRDIHHAASAGDKQAQLAIEIFCYQIKKYVGAYAAVLGRVDAIIFTGGIGENDAKVRAEVCENLSILGIRLDIKQNSRDLSAATALHSTDSKVQIWMIPANEELQIAIEAAQLLTQRVHTAN